MVKKNSTGLGRIDEVPSSRRKPNKRDAFE